MKRTVPGIQVREFTSISSSELPFGSGEVSWGTAVVHVKAQTADKPVMLANELIGARLAAAIGLPVLPGEIATDPDGRQCWITPQITASGGDVPPADTDALLGAHGDLCAGILAFDAWTGNIDRTDENLLFATRTGVWLIDHEHILDGPSATDPSKLLRLSPITEHILAHNSLDEKELNYWISRIETVATRAIENPVIEAFERGLLHADMRDAYKRAILDRRTRVRDLIREARGRAKPADIVQLELVDGGD